MDRTSRSLGLVGSRILRREPRIKKVGMEGLRLRKRLYLGTLVGGHSRDTVLRTALTITKLVVKGSKTWFSCHCGVY